MATITEYIANEVAKEQFSNVYANKNIIILEDNTIRTKADNSIITKKALKKNRQILQKGRHFCNCGFIIISSEGKGVKNREVKLRLHKKVCPEEKK